MIVKVIVDIPAAQVNRTFDYQVPETLQSLITLGVRVQVPFGPRQLLGFVVDISQASEFEGDLKPIVSVLDYESFINQELIELSDYLANYLQAYRIQVLQAMLPSMLKVKYRNEFVVRRREVLRELAPELSDVDETIDKTVLESQLSRKVIKQLLDERALELVYRLENQASVKTIAYVKPAQAYADLSVAVNDLPQRSHKLRQLLQYMVAHNIKSIALNDLAIQSDVSQATIKSAIEKGYLVRYQQQVYRDPLSSLTIEATSARQFKPQQQQAYEQIYQAMQKKQPTTFLVEGVTGSGKTEIYLQLMAQARSAQQGAILLVPEIALTPQMVQQVTNRFQSGVAVLHSGLSTAEKYDEWRRIIRGEATIVVGARSSIFAPVQNLGLIIIDEEHETTYKQSEAPRYHAREVALWRAAYHYCPLVLGSATPSLESRSRAEVGRYQLIQLTERVNQRPLPPVTLVDMTKEIGQKSNDELSSLLKQRIQTCLERQEQVVLLLNRRGYASYMQCRECGHVIQCPRCDISLTYHKQDYCLKCHYCDYQQAVPTTCPQCQSDYLRQFGLGTQKIEELLLQQFPTARVIRMDMDTTRRKGQHEALLATFRRHEADILLGTQMIAKGLDFERVTLVGVINADTALNLPDFRASEKTFQLLTQVAGRTGRGRFDGEVLIQTYNPEHYVMQLAQQHDYEAFFYYEMKRRHLGNYPPYFYTTLLTVSSKQQGKAQQSIYEIKQQLVKAQVPIEILGPSRGAIARMNDRYYFQMLLKYKDKSVIQPQLNDILAQSQQEAKYGISIVIDHEPLFFN